MTLRALMVAIESFNDQFPEDDETRKFGDAPSRAEWEAHKAAMSPEQRAWHGFKQAA